MNGSQTAKRKKQLSYLLDRQPSVGAEHSSSFVKEEGSKAGIPKESAEQHGKYGKKGV